MSVLTPVVKPKNLKSTSREFVYQHNELIEATYKMSLPAKRLFLMLISTVDPYKAGQNQKKITIHAKDYAKLCDVSMSVAYKHLCSASTELMKTIIIARDPKKSIVTKYVVSPEVEYHDKSGLITCKLADKIMPMVENLKKNYAKLELAAATKFKRFYTIRIYELLIAKDSDKMHRKLKISIEDFKTILGVNALSAYKDFGQLNSRVIQPSLKEIAEKTDLIVELELVRWGRRIKTLIFTFEHDKQMDMFK
jgi:plasmid replication initiation protein